MPPGAKDTPCPPSLPQSSPQHPMPRGGGPRSDGLWSKKSCSNAHPGSTVSPLPPKLAMVWVGGLSLLGGGTSSNSLVSFVPTFAHTTVPLLPSPTLWAEPQSC